MKIILRTNDDDWRELEYRTNGERVMGHAGHDIPEWFWLDLLTEIGVEVVKVFDDFGVR